MLRTTRFARLARWRAATTLPSRDEWWGRPAGSSEPIPPRTGAGDITKLRKSKADTINKLPEVQQRELFFKRLQAGTCDAPVSGLTIAEAGMTEEQLMMAIEAGMATILLHTESRIASSLGLGFYTIGPGGEELMGAVGLALRSTDPMALHYRHLATQIARQRAGGKGLDDILLDRARGHVVSTQDPVTGGVHCAIGGGPYDFISTSTLSSQTPPAVGRALAVGLAAHLKVPSAFERDAVSFVSLGDGSVNNAHFLAALNTAAYSNHRRNKCAVVFCITDNHLSISLKGYNYLQTKFMKKLRGMMPVFEATGTDVFDIFRNASEAIGHARSRSCPVVLLVKDVPRRFGHAATDRQAAYLTPAEIARAAATNPLDGACAQAVASGITTYSKLAEMFRSIEVRTQQAFDVALDEPKHESRAVLLDRASAPLRPLAPTAVRATRAEVFGGDSRVAQKEKQVMRKWMTRVLDEQLAARPNMVYIGEDVEHGGYYLVTDSWDLSDTRRLAQKYTGRVIDFPPDETSLVGAGMGFAQARLLPIVEIPYAKYLDCGADMFFEAAIMNWLSNGRQPNGMVIRLQGFDRGVFGGNFHTHNMLHLPPGIDVVCYSNGADYARGMRHALHQAEAGRIVMLVDSTNLLNLRHVTAGDDAWLRPYPAANEVMTFDEVRTYGDGRKLALVSYGNGVVTSLQARAELGRAHQVSGVSVIDVPYISDVADGLRQILKNYERVLFVDPCKGLAPPLAGIATALHNESRLPRDWRIVVAPRTYNPLGCTLTFTNVDDVVGAALSLCRA